MCCPQVEFLENWVGRSECVVIFFFSKFPKAQNLGAFSTIFIKKKKKKMNKIGCYPDNNFFNSRLGSFAIFFSWPE